MIKTYDIVRLKRDYPEHGVASGTEGTVLMTFDNPRPGYLVEVADTDGVTIATIAAGADEVELVSSIPE